MRRRSTALVALVAAIALMALAAPAWAAKAKAKPKALVVSPTEVQAGQMVTVSGGCKTAGQLAFSIDSKEFHRGYTKRGSFSYDLKVPRGLEAGSHRMNAQCRDSEHTAAHFTVKKGNWGSDDDCDDEGYGDDDEKEGYEANVAYGDDCDTDEKHHHRTRAWFDVSPEPGRLSRSSPIA